MTERPAFEVQLARAFAAYADGAPVDVDPAALAAAASTHGSRRATRTGRPVARASRRLILLAAAALLLSVAIGVVAVGAPTLLVDRRPVLPSAAHGIAPFGDLPAPRFAPVVVGLVDGRFLVAGGSDQDVVPAYVLDPDGVRPPVVVPDGPYGSGPAVRLADGRVFMILFDSNHTSSRAWIFDPAGKTFHEVAADPTKITAPRFHVWPSMALLQDGTVLIAGGIEDLFRRDGSDLASALVFDPASATFGETGSMTRGRRDQSMTTLSDGRVLVVGGTGLYDEASRSFIRDADLYDPRLRTFRPTGRPQAIQTRGILAVPTPDGGAIIFPQAGSDPSAEPLADAVAAHAVPVEVYDAATGTFRAAATTNLPPTSATRLTDGSILLTFDVTVGTTPDGEETHAAAAALYDPVRGETPLTTAPRSLAPAWTTLTDGRIVFVGRSPDGITPSPVDLAD